MLGIKDSSVIRSANAGRLRSLKFDLKKTHCREIELPDITQVAS